MEAAPIEGAMDVLREAATLEGVTVALVSGRDVDTLGLLSGTTPQDAIDLIGSHGGQSSPPAWTPGCSPSTKKHWPSAE